MKMIENIFVDSLNGFPLSQIPLFIFQLLCAAIGAHILQIILNKKLKESVLSHSALIALSVALISSIVKYSLPFSVLGAAVILLLFQRKEKSKLETIANVFVVLIGVGCGVGSVIQTIIGCILLFAILLFTPLKK